MMLQPGNTRSSEAEIQRLLDEVSASQKTFHELRLSALEAHLTEFSTFQESRAERKRQQISAFLESRPIQDLYQERLKRLMQSGERFNIFSALWLDRRENYHSRFIAYLLDPRAHHDQGGKFLRCFFDKLGIEDSSSISVASISAEYSVGELGRLDLVISTPQSIIVIENKIDAGEQEDQISRYRRWLDDNHHGRKRKQCSIFLTPTGSLPTTGKADLNWSYREVVDWLDDSLKSIPETAIPVRAVVEQYKRICRSIANGGYIMADIDRETFDLLTRDNNLAVALEISRLLESVKERIKIEFVQNVEQKLKELLGDNIIWRVFSSPKDGLISLQSQSHSKNAPNYQCAIQNLFTFANIGWLRPNYIQDLQSDNIDTKILSDEMKKREDFGIHGWWVGVKSLEPCLNIADDKIIVDIFNDNNSQAHRMAEQVANALWLTYERYYKQIETLDSFKKALL